MSPNQPKTPISSFRLSEKTRGDLQRAAEALDVNMTEALRRATEAFAPMVAIAKEMEEESNTFPMEAYTEAAMAYRGALDLGPGDRLPDSAFEAIRAVIAASWPIICEEKIAQERRRTLVDVITRLEGFQVDADVIRHFVSLLDA